MNLLTRNLLIASAMLVLVVTAVEAADTSTELRRNPFERPIAEPAEPLPAAAGGAKSIENPGLRAVLFAGPKSVVNFGGAIMQVGESVNGYELLSVAEGAATFRYEGKTIVFSLYEQDGDSE